MKVPVHPKLGSLAFLAVTVLLLLPYRWLLDALLLGPDSLVWARQVEPAVDQGGLEGLRRLAEIVFSNHFGVFFRPLATLSFAVGSHPGSEWIVHLLDLLLVAALFLVIYHLARRLLGLSPPLALLGVVLFGLHPVLPHVIPYPSSRNDLMLAVFAALYLGMATARSATALRVLALVGALGSKEQGLVLPVTFLLATALQVSGPPGVRLRHALGRARADLLVLLLFVALRQWVLGSLGGYESDQLGDRWFLPFGYLSGTLTPAVYAVDLSLPLRVALVLVASTFLGVGAWFSARPFSRLCLIYLGFELSIHTFQGVVLMRQLYTAAALTCLVMLDQLAHRPRFGVALVCVLGLPWCLQSVVSQPWSGLKVLAEGTEEYVNALAAEVRKKPPGTIRVFCLDVDHHVPPFPFSLPVLAPNCRSPLPNLRARIPAEVVRFVNDALRDEDHKVVLFPLAKVGLPAASSRYWFDLEGQSREEVRVRLAGDPVDLELPATLAPEVLEDPTRQIKVSLAPLHRTAFDYLFFRARDRAELVALPQGLVVAGAR